MKRRQKLELFCILMGNDVLGSFIRPSGTMEYPFTIYGNKCKIIPGVRGQLIFSLGSFNWSALGAAGFA